MTKRFGLILLIAVPCLAAVILGVIAATGYFNQRSQEHLALIRTEEYLRTKYDFEFETARIDSYQTGWPTGPRETKIVFHDLTNDIYFEMLCGGGTDDITDYYDEAFQGKQIAVKINQKFSDNGIDYYFRCFGKKTDDPDISYEGFTAQMFVITEDFNRELPEIYSMVRYLGENYSGIRLILLVSPYRTEKDIKGLIEYKKVIPISEIEHTYFADIILYENAEITLSDFRDMLNK